MRRLGGVVVAVVLAQLAPARAQGPLYDIVDLWVYGPSAINERRQLSIGERA